MIKKLGIVLIFLLPYNHSYAQDPELFEHTWYLQKVVVEGEEYPLSDLNDEDYFFAIVNELNFYDENDTEYLAIYFCNYWSSAFYQDNDTGELNLFDFEPGLLEECGLEGTPGFEPIATYEDLYISVFKQEDEEPYIPKNPFIYTLETDGKNYTLTIENPDGDYAVYSDEQLSTGKFEDFKFSVHPNPASDILHIQNLETTAKAIVYDLNGRQIKTKNISATDREINISQLQNGLYFLVLENPEGARQAVKFVKK